MMLVVPATNRPDICFVRTNSVRSATFQRRVGPQLTYVSRSTSRHSPILVGYDYKIGKVEGNVAWQALPGVAGGWGGNEVMRIGQGIRFQPFPAYLGPWGGRFGPISLFVGVPLLCPYLPIISLFPRFGCAV